MKYDVFISYRRDGGASTARILRDRLSELGYKVFFDVESLRSGYFNTALYSVIDQCKDVIVVLSPNALDRCVNEDDWVRKEVEHALHQKKNVVPVMLRGFEFPKALPDSIDQLRFCNGIEANEDFFDAFIEKLQGFLRAKPGLFQGILQNRFLKRMIPALLAVVLVFGGYLGFQAVTRDRTYPHTAQEKNLTQEMVYHVSQNLTRFDILAETYTEALDAASQYLSSGMTDNSAMKSQFAITRQMLTQTELETAKPSEDLIQRLSDTPFDTAEVRAMYDNLVLFRDDCLACLDYLEEMLQPDYYPTDGATKLKILGYYQLILEENLKVYAYAANQMLLPVTNEEALEVLWHESLPYLSYIPLRAVNWNDDYDALQSAINESLNTIEKAITDRALIVGDSAMALEQMEQDIIQELMDKGYTQATAEKIWAYQTDDPEARREKRIQDYLKQGLSQTEAEELADREEQMLEAQAKIRLSTAALVTDDVNTLWEKMTMLLAVGLYEEALECAALYQQQMTNSDHYYIAMQLFVHMMQQTDLDYGVMVMEYYEADGIHEVLQIGDIIYGFDGLPCHDHEEYIAMKEALTTDSYTVDVLRIDKTGQWESLQLTLTTDMPRVYLNNLVYSE